MDVDQCYVLYPLFSEGAWDFVYLCNKDQLGSDRSSLFRSHRVMWAKFRMQLDAAQDVHRVSAQPERFGGCTEEGKRKSLEFVDGVLRQFPWTARAKRVSSVIGLKCQCQPLTASNLGSVYPCAGTNTQKLQQFNVYGCQNTSISSHLSCLMAKMLPDRMQLNNVVDEVKGHFQTAVRVISTSTFKQIESISA